MIENLMMITGAILYFAVSVYFGVQFIRVIKKDGGSITNIVAFIFIAFCFLGFFVGILFLFNQVWNKFIEFLEWL